MAETGEGGAGDPEQGPGRRARLLTWLGLAAAMVMVLVGRAAWEGAAELAQADAADDLDTEIVHLGRAARWRLPGFGHDERALERLEAIGDEARVGGAQGRQRALVAYREIRRALLGTRAWSVPQPDTLQRVNEHIAGLMAEAESPTGSAEHGALAEKYLTELEAVPGPDPALGKLGALAFLVWMASIVGFVGHGLDPQGRVRKRLAVRWGALVVVSLVVWALVMRFA